MTADGHNDPSVVFLICNTMSHFYKSVTRITPTFAARNFKTKRL